MCQPSENIIWIFLLVLDLNYNIVPNQYVEVIYLILENINRKQHIYYNIIDTILKYFIHIVHPECKESTSKFFFAADICPFCGLQ